MLRELRRGGTTPDESETLEGETKSEVQLCPTHLSLVEHLRQNGQWVIILWQESYLIDFCSCSMCFLFICRSQLKHVRLGTSGGQDGLGGLAPLPREGWTPIVWTNRKNLLFFAQFNFAITYKSSSQNVKPNTVSC